MYGLGLCVYVVCIEICGAPPEYCCVYMYIYIYLYIHVLLPSLSDHI